MAGNWLCRLTRSVKTLDRLYCYQSLQCKTRFFQTLLAFVILVQMLQITSHHLTMYVTSLLRPTNVPHFSINVLCLLILICSFVLIKCSASLEYNSVIWPPSTIHNIETTESEQCHFTKRIHGLHSFHYKLCLQRVNLKSLEHCRLLTNLVWCYKLDFSLVIDRPKIIHGHCVYQQTDSLATEFQLHHRK